MQPENTPEIFDWYNNNYSSAAAVVGNNVIPTTTAASNNNNKNEESFCSWAYYCQRLAELPEIASENSAAEGRAQAASKNHRDAERRRRQRINYHLDSLRALLPSHSRTDKASLLAKVVERVRELKQEASHHLTEADLPSESDDVTLILSGNDNNNNNDGRLLIKASVCCEDRTDLITDIIHALKSLRLSPLRAEMVSLGGRTKNVMILAGDSTDHGCVRESIMFLSNALRSVVDRDCGAGGGDRSKRRRSNY